MEIRIVGECTVLRQVRLEDATFIANLRSEPKVYEYLSSSAPISSAMQENWLLNYFNTKDGFYFIIENPIIEKSVGTISLYNRNDERREAEFGRYISLNSINAVEAEYLLLKFCFDVLKLNQIYCRTADKNIKVWKQHSSFGFKDAGFEDFVDKGLLLKKQIITNSEFINFDYSKIISLINRFSN